jgi:hypothetical protein
VYDVALWWLIIDKLMPTHDVVLSVRAEIPVNVLTVDGILL